MGFAENYFHITDGKRICELADYARYLRDRFPDIEDGKLIHVVIGHLKRGHADSGAVGQPATGAQCVFKAGCKTCEIATKYREATGEN